MRQQCPLLALLFNVVLQHLTAVNHEKWVKNQFQTKLEEKCAPGCCKAMATNVDLGRTVLTSGGGKSEENPCTGGAGRTTLSHRALGSGKHCCAGPAGVILKFLIILSLKLMF